VEDLRDRRYRAVAIHPHRIDGWGIPRKELILLPAAHLNSELILLYIISKAFNIFSTLLLKTPQPVPGIVHRLTFPSLNLGG
jgi:hypothetical protein